MSIISYYKVGMYVNEVYEDSEFDHMINRFADNYPTLKSRVDHFIHYPVPHSPYSYARA